MRVALKKMLVFSVKASSLSGSVEMSVVMSPSCRQATENFDGSSFSPSGWPQPPLRACERDEAGDTGHFWVVELADADLVAGRREFKRRANAAQVVGAGKAQRGEEHDSRQDKRS